MSEFGSLYIKLGEPEGELCGCTCEVGNWAAKHIAELTEQRDKLLEALGLAADMLDMTGQHPQTVADIRRIIAAT